MAKSAIVGIVACIIRGVVATQLEGYENDNNSNNQSFRLGKIYVQCSKDAPMPSYSTSSPCLRYCWVERRHYVV